MTFRSPASRPGAGQAKGRRSQAKSLCHHLAPTDLQQNVETPVPAVRRGVEFVFELPTGLVEFVDSPTAGCGGAIVVSRRAGPRAAAVSQAASIVRILLPSPH